MTGIERIAVEIIAGLFLVWATILYLENHGAEKCRAADRAAVTAQEARNAAQAVADATAINDEAKTYADTLRAPDPIDAPHARLCYYTPTRVVPPAAPARPVPDGPAPSRAPDSVDPGADVGPPLAKVGVDSDMQTKLLQDYIKNVCLAR